MSVPYSHLHLGLPENAGAWLRFRLMVRKEYKDGGPAMWWKWRVLDMCIPVGVPRVIRNGERDRWQDALTEGLRERNKAEQEWVWGSDGRPVLRGGGTRAAVRPGRRGRAAGAGRAP